MTDVNLFSQSQGQQTDWVLHGSGSKVTATTDDNGDTSAIKSATNTERESQYVDALPSATDVTNVDMIWKAKDNNSGSETCQAETLLGASTTSLTDRTLVGGTYTSYTESAVARPGGGSWAPTDFPGGTSGAELGWKKTNTGGGTAFVTYAYFTVTYNPPAGGFMWLLGSWLPPLIEVASHGLSVDDIGSFFRSFNPRPSKDEYDKVLWQFLRRPVYAIPG